MAAKFVLILICLLVAGNQIRGSDEEFGHFIDYELTEEISLDKLNREISHGSFLGSDEETIAKNVVEKLASSMDKSELKAVAGRYSVYELLDMNTYWKNYMHYCSQSEVEFRQRRCDYLAENDQYENLKHYCLYCASQYFEACQRNIPEILSKRIFDKNQLTPLKLKNLRQMVKNFRAWIRRDGYDKESDSFNFEKFIADPKNIPAIWSSIRTTCMEVFKQFSDVLYFDSQTKLSVDYLERHLPDKHKDKAIVGHCGTFIKVTEPKLREHQLLKDEPKESALESDD